jgi:hypothetical protein
LDLQVARKNENTANPIAAKLVGKMKRAVNGRAWWGRCRDLRIEEDCPCAEGESFEVD